MVKGYWSLLSAKFAGRVSLESSGVGGIGVPSGSSVGIKGVGAQKNGIYVQKQKLVSDHFSYGIAVEFRIFFFGGGDSG